MPVYEDLTSPPLGTLTGQAPTNSATDQGGAIHQQLDLDRCTLKQLTGTSSKVAGLFPLKAVPTPPDSPNRLRPAKMNLQESKMHDSGAMTPPATPTSPLHFKSSSISSIDLGIQTPLARKVSTTSTASAPRSPSIHSHPVALRVFDHEAMDYVVLVDEKGKKRPIGSGVWSDVYLAAPSLPKPADHSFLLPPSATKLLPISPVQSNDTAVGLHPFHDEHSLYAIKAPASTSSRKVLKEEAKILSYLSQFPDSEDHIVQFFGQDTRNDALVLKAMDGTLNDWIKKDLNTLDEDARAAKLAYVFPRLALALVDSLIWMQDKNCIHADIKPANVLTAKTTTDLTSVPSTVYSDFSSTILVAPEIEVHNASPLGAGTWDYLDPSLLSSSAPVEPSSATDLWSLAITILFLVIGTSPFDAFKHNKYQQREMIKTGNPLQCLAYDDSGIKNMRKMKDLSKTLGLDLQKWFAKVLVKDVSKRISVEAWREELANAAAKMGPVI